MAYEKQTWTNDASAVLDTRMNHIEQGIYDNSLATDKINPSGTATTTAEIEEGQINDVIGFKSLKLKGQTSQYTTTGVNLLPNNETSKTINGVTFTKNEDGSILVKGTATSNAQYDLLLPSANVSISAGDYYLNGCPSGGASETYRLVIGVDDTLYGEYGTGRAVTLSSGILKSYIFIANGATVNNLLYKPMLVSGSTAKPYEKYSGGKVSPNPDFPQEVNNVSGYNIVGISNINLLDESKLRQGAYIKATNNTRLFIDSNNYLEVGTYTVVTNLDLTKFRYGADVASTPFPLDVGKPIDIFDAGWITNSNHLTFSITQRGYLGVGISKTNASNNITPSEVADYWFMVYKGTYDSNITYQEHQGNNFEINLGKNLFNKDDSSLIFNGFANRSSLKLESNASAKTICQPCKPNTTYTISKILSARFFVDETSSSTISNGISITPLSTGSSSNVTSYTVTTSASAKYLLVYYYVSSADTLTEEEIRNSIQIEKGAIATSFADYFPPIEICKIGTFQDYIFKKDGKWYKHKEISNYILNGGNNENWLLNSSGTYYKYQWATALPDKYNVANTPLYCNYFKQINVQQGDGKNIIGIVNGHYSDYSLQIISDISTLSDFKTWLSTNNPVIYYPIATPIDEEITYAPLLRQLDELYNSGLYDVTNISQDNSSEAFILDMEACKNNINGIVEYIRR